MNKTEIKKIGIYIWEIPYRYGGTESCAVKFAWALQQIFPEAFVEFVAEIYDKKDIPENKSFIQRLNNLAGTKIDENRAGLKSVLCSKKSRLSRSLMYKKIQNASKEFDLFFYCSRGNFSFKAKKNVAIIHFPSPSIVNEKKQQGKFDLKFLTALKDKRYAETYDLLLPNSKFTEKWLKILRPDIDDSKIIQMYHPVIPIPSNGEKKVKSILTCSRIERAKKLDDLIKAYINSDWLKNNYELWICGNYDRDNPGYIEELKKLGEGYNIKFFLAVSHDELVSLYNKAEFFWHSKGYGEDENKVPYLMEHFGMTTVEAMSAGCIPVVINKGGQPEIVKEGTGYLWNTTDELVKITEECAKLPEEKRILISQNARKRSADFKLEELPVKLEQLLEGI